MALGEFCGSCQFHHFCRRIERCYEEGIYIKLGETDMVDIEDRISSDDFPGMKQLITEPLKKNDQATKEEVNILKRIIKG